MKNGDFEDAAHPLWVELVQFQRHVIERGLRVLLILEGRDAAGKDGALRALARHWSPREFRVFAPSKPTERERGSWYFQRFVAQLPAAGEIVCFNRSWYNRAGVEKVMGYCTAEEHEVFLRDVGAFERLLVDDGLRLQKYYLDVSRKEQAKRLAERRADPLKQWKISPVDARAQELWDDYTAARDEMFARSSHDAAPWRVVRADDKKEARLALMREVLAAADHPGRCAAAAAPDRERVRPWTPRLRVDGFLSD